MALAGRIASYEQGSAARSLPSEERVQEPVRRPAVRRQPRRSARSLVFTAMGWMAVVALCLVMVHRNVMVLAERGEITSVKEQLAQVERQNAELETQIASAKSLQAVETYAKNKGMVRPVAIKTVAGDPTAVAARPADPAPVAAAPHQAKAISFLSAIKTALAHWSAGAKTAAAAGR
jgi:cell division protein FtsL